MSFIVSAGNNILRFTNAVATISWRALEKHYQRGDQKNYRCYFQNKRRRSILVRHALFRPVTYKTFPGWPCARALI